uniref:Uncharacterized protein n=1 Tax=Arundo donax TaxID=35708 RepID=A0A0A9H8J5_ARUDO
MKSVRMFFFASLYSLLGTSPYSLDSMCPSLFINAYRLVCRYQIWIV